MKSVVLIYAMLCTFFLSLCAETIEANSFENQTIKIVYDSKLKPYSYLSDGRMQGVLVDIMDEIFVQRLKMKVLHQGESFRKANKSLRSGRQDAFVNVSNQQLRLFSSSSNIIYMAEHKAFISKQTYDFGKIMTQENPLKERSLRFIALSHDFSTKKLYEKNRIKYTQASNIAQIAKNLSSGKVDVFLYNQDIMRTYINRNNLTHKIHMHTNAYQSIPFTFMLSNKSTFSDELINIVNNTIQSFIKSDEYRTVLESSLKKHVH